MTIEDVKYVLSSHFQGTPYDPYASYGDKSMKGAYRAIGVKPDRFSGNHPDETGCRRRQPGNRMGSICFERI